MPGELRLPLNLSIESLDSSSLRFGKYSCYDLIGKVRSGGAGGIATKRIVDVALASTLLLVFSPVIALMAAAVALGGGRPFFAHERVGRGGRSFLCWKIRTMRRDADVRLADLIQVDPRCRRQWETDRKLSPDPRTTTLGRLLRRTCLDELPQLWNVVVGEMSLVGPRPVTREELARFGASAGAYLAARPGVTGLWQVCRRPETTYDERVAMERYYLDNRSLGLDAAILLLTLRVPFAPTGAEARA